MQVGHACFTSLRQKHTLSLGLRKTFPGTRPPNKGNCRRGSAGCRVCGAKIILHTRSGDQTVWWQRVCVFAFFYVCVCLCVCGPRISRYKPCLKMPNELKGSCDTVINKNCNSSLQRNEQASCNFFQLPLDGGILINIKNTNTVVRYSHDNQIGLIQVVCCCFCAYFSA